MQQQRGANGGLDPRRFQRWRGERDDLELPLFRDQDHDRLDRERQQPGRLREDDVERAHLPHSPTNSAPTSTLSIAPCAERTDCLPVSLDRMGSPESRYSKGT
jgi:hypothetical protein